MKNIKNRIRILGLAAFAGLAVTSCDLEMLPLSEVVLENYWTNKSDVESVVTSCYTGMSNSDFISKLITWSELRSDNVQAGIKAANETDYRNMINGNLLESNAVACDWAVVYTAINRCNTVIEYAPQVQEKDPNYTESDLKANLAEVKAIRALCYFYLIRSYKDVPFVTDPSIDDTQDFQQPATKHEVILDSLIADLEEIKNYAPRKYVKEIDNTARITRNAIYSLLADMYLWRASDANASPAKAREDYMKCVEYCDKVIEYKIEQYKIDEFGTIKRQVSTTCYNTYGYPLLAANGSVGSTGSGNLEYPQSYISIFGEGNSFESIFEFTFPENQSERNEAIKNFYGSLTEIGAYLEASENLLGESGPSTSYSTGNTNIFTCMDRRAAEGFYYPGESGNYNIRKYVANMVGVKVGTNEASWGAGASSYRTADTSNWIVYRLTDVMLMKAEAEVQLAGYISQNAEGDNTEEGGGNVETKAAFGNVYTTAQEYYDDAFNIVCAVYYRASTPTSTSNIIDQSQFITQTDYVNLVEAERHRELLFEGKRYYDLVRRARREGNTTHYAECLSSKFASNASVMKIKMAMLDFMYTPYYEAELDANPKLVQNPAYVQDKTTEKN